MLDLSIRRGPRNPAPTLKDWPKSTRGFSIEARDARSLAAIASGHTMRAMDSELVQIAERALADAEQAYRLDPSEEHQRKVMQAWSFVRRAREQACAEQQSSAEPAPEDD